MQEVKIIAAAPPPGQHRMRCDQREDIVGRWGTPAFKWHFVVPDGEYAGAVVSKTTGTEVKLGESLAEFLAEVSGQKLEPGSVIDIDEPLGRLFDVLIAVRNGSSGTFIHKVSPVNDE